MNKEQLEKELRGYYRTGCFHIYLRGNHVFTPTTYYWNNQQILKKEAEKTYWYFDFFHRENKIHYEVFNHEAIT